VLAVSTAFAGPLLGLTGAEGGGLNLHGPSSKGKTTALQAAASVWGRGATDPGFVRSWRGTANSQESGAALVSDTLLCLDEIGVAEARDAAARSTSSRPESAKGDRVATARSASR
jgi:uncharacterized protein (DUF927 family)